MGVFKGRKWSGSVNVPLLRSSTSTRNSNTRPLSHTYQGVDRTRPLGAQQFDGLEHVHQLVQLHSLDGRVDGAERPAAAHAVAGEVQNTRRVRLRTLTADGGGEGREGRRGRRGEEGKCTVKPTCSEQWLSRCPSAAVTAGQRSSGPGFLRARRARCGPASACADDASRSGFGASSEVKKDKREPE